jgi:hypothetical protein
LGFGNFYQYISWKCYFWNKFPHHV